MPTPFKRSLRFVFRHEGGFTKNEKDKGNWTGGRVGSGTLKGTNRGISAASYPDEDIAGMTEERAAEIYRCDFWEVCRCDELPEPIAFLTFDMAVNAGPGNGIRILQRAVGATADGIIGPQTIAAANRADPRQAVIRFTVERLFHYIGLGTFSTFGRGWLTRSVDAAITAATLAQSAPSLSPSLAAPTPAEIEDELAGGGEKEAPPAVPIAITVVAAAIFGALVLALR